MGQVLLLLVVALTVAAVVFGVTVLVTGRDPGLAPVEPDGRAVPLPVSRPLRESDVGDARFDTAPRGYRMSQVDQAMRRAAYDIGYKSELIGVLEAEVTALREGRVADADALRHTREQAAAAAAEQAAGADAPSTAAAPAAAAATGAAAADAPTGDAAPAAVPATGADLTVTAAAPEAGDREPTDRPVGSEPA
ncbi:MULTISPECIES: DivIVA domain-containing protein [Micromonospora]|uniref:DivIVA domain-containing protein n=1 Tax=Micromonospora TaxID=1873 RepID=UPI00098D3ABD|nr:MULTISPECIES: DivIVA domain-containing protein [unclassified Micromonospora]MDI5937313.1 DivIVA domain-containing protein [Micromonospora sp. DH15]